MNTVFMVSEVTIHLLTKLQTLAPSVDASMITREEPLPYEVVCVLRGSGFPHGAADAPRIINVGKALLSAGIGFRVLHCGPSLTEANLEASGIYEGIPYEYTTFTTRRPNAFALRAFLYAWGLAVLVIRLLQLFSERHSTCIYIYIQDGPIGLITASICRVLGLHVVQEVNEWWPETKGCSQFNRWLFKGPMFSLATGALVISTLIEERARVASDRLNHRLILHRMPIIADLSKFQGSCKPLSLAGIDPALPYFAWCGGVAAFIEDVYFMIRCLAKVKQSGLLSQLVIVGGVDRVTRQLITRYAKSRNVGGLVVLAGFIDDDQLVALYKSASGLLLPLWDDDRSRTRFPTKLAGYLASGTPVVTCEVGDLREFLKNGESAYVGTPGDERDFAANMEATLRDLSQARSIGDEGRRVCQTEMDYTRHAEQLAEFFISCIRSAHDR